MVNPSITAHNSEKDSMVDPGLCTCILFLQTVYSGSDITSPDSRKCLQSIEISVNTFKRILEICTRTNFWRERIFVFIHGFSRSNRVSILCVAFSAAFRSISSLVLFVFGVHQAATPQECLSYTTFINTIKRIVSLHYI